MANRILKGLAVAAGTGLAMGFTSGRAGRTRIIAGSRGLHDHSTPPEASPVASPVPFDEPDEFLNIEPLLDRLESLEARVESIGQQPPISHRASSEVPHDLAGAIADLERRVDENTRELALLRESITEAERRAGEAAASTQRNVEFVRAEIPAIVERHVAARIDALEDRFAAKSSNRTSARWRCSSAPSMKKISSRIGSIERALAEQAGSIESLSLRTTETDNNLQRLVAAIEKLCERAQLIAPAPEQQFTPAQLFQKPRQYETRLPFEEQMHDAMRREPVVPVLRTEEPVVEIQVQAPAFAAGAASKEAAPKKPRFLFRNLIVAGLSLLGSRLFR